MSPSARWPATTLPVLTFWWRRELLEDLGLGPAERLRLNLVPDESYACVSGSAACCGFLSGAGHCLGLTAGRSLALSWPSIIRQSVRGILQRSGTPSSGISFRLVLDSRLCLAHSSSESRRPVVSAPARLLRRSNSTGGSYHFERGLYRQLLSPRANHICT